MIDDLKNEFADTSKNGGRNIKKEDAEEYILHRYNDKKGGHNYDNSRVQEILRNSDILKKEAGKCYDWVNRKTIKNNPSQVTYSVDDIINSLPNFSIDELEALIKSAAKAMDDKSKKLNEEAAKASTIANKYNQRGN